MISTGTKVRVIDNSGAKLARCLRVIGKVQKASGRIGDVIRVSIVESRPHRRVKAGQICDALIVQTKAPFSRPDGTSLSISKIGIVLMNDKGSPIGTRVNGTFTSEIRRASKKVWQINKGKSC